MEMTMNELIKAAINGDQTAVTQLYNETYNNVYQTIKAIIGTDEDTVLDLVQDTYIRAFKYIGQLDQPENFRAWAKRIGANTAKNYLKKKKPVLFSQLSKEEEDEPQEFQFQDDRSEHMPEVVMDQKETTRLIGDILGTLSEDQRLALTMFYFDEMSVKEIAEELECSENTVKSRLNYGRKKVETKVRDLEKKGTKLYGLAPLPFFLLLLRSMEAKAAVAPSAEVLHAVQASVAGTVTGGGTSVGAGATAGSGSAAGHSAASVATKSTAKTVAKTATKKTAQTVAKAGIKGISTKAVAGAAAVAIAGGAGAAAYYANRPNTAREEFVQAYEYVTENNLSEIYDTMEVYFYSEPRSKKDWDVVVVLLNSEEVNSYVKNYGVIEEGKFNEYSIEGSPKILWVDGDTIDFECVITAKVRIGDQVEARDVIYDTVLDLKNDEQPEKSYEMEMNEDGELWNDYLPRAISTVYYTPLEASLTETGYEKILNIVTNGSENESGDDSVINVSGNGYVEVGAQAHSEVEKQNQVVYFNSDDFEEITSEYADWFFDAEVPSGVGICFGFSDVNGDGMAELLIVDTFREKGEDSVTYTALREMYTLVDGEPVLAEEAGISKENVDIGDEDKIDYSYSIENGYPDE